MRITAAAVGCLVGRCESTGVRYSERGAAAGSAGAEEGTHVFLDQKKCTSKSSAWFPLFPLSLSLFFFHCERRRTKKRALKKAMRALSLLVALAAAAAMAVEAVRSKDARRERERGGKKGGARSVSSPLMLENKDKKNLFSRPPPLRPFFLSFSFS